MVIGSGVGVKAAVKRKQENTATRHGRKIVLPEIMPNKFKATRKIGNINAKPKIKISQYPYDLSALNKNKYILFKKLKKLFLKNFGLN